MAGRNLSEERELLAKIAEGDQMAFKKIYDTYFSRTYAFSFYVLHSRELAQEVVQEVMLKLWQMGFEVLDIQNLEAYLKMLAKRRAIDVLRRRELEKRIEKEMQSGWEEEHNETEQAIVLNETRKIIEEGVSLLPHQQRLVYQLCRQSGMKYEEVAERLNIAPGTVQKHMKLALKFLRVYVQDRSDLAVLLIIFKLL
jgi:RNA polymerase sigma-70 factor (family 1)